MAGIKVNGTSIVKAYSLDYQEYVEFGLNENDTPEQSWARYIFGVCRETIKRGGKVEGFNTVFAGTYPWAPDYHHRQRLKAPMLLHSMNFLITV